MGVCTASGRLGAMVAQIANAKLMMKSSSSDKEDESSIASAWVLVVASLALLFGAFMPVFLGRDASGGELKDDLDEVGQGNASRLVGCGNLWKSNKDHLSDEEADANGVSKRGKKDALQVLEYDSFRHEVETNQPFLL